MKRVFAVLFFLMLPLVPLGAQGLQGRILIVRDSVWQAEDRVEALLPTIYMGGVDSMSSLPQNISQYDAIMFFVDRPNGSPRDTISIQDEFRLIDYLKNGGRLYAEGTFFSSQFYYSDSDLHDTLWRFLGLQFEGLDAVVVNYYRVHGVDSEFTRGIDTSFPPPTGDDADYFPRGNITPVLFATADEDYIFGWIPSDRSIRAVVHHVDVGFIDTYYAPFLTRVLCDYFGLCTDAVQEQKSAPRSDLRVVEDGDETWLVVTGPEASELDIVNTLGVKVFHSMVSAGGEKIAVPANLPSGIYFARLRGKGLSEMRPFALIQK